MSTTEESFVSHGAPRLLEERKRLGLSQAAAASACSVSREVWGKYERGQATPGADVLMKFAVVGADIGYILTGQSAGREAVPANPREAALLDNYRHSPKDQQEVLEKTASAFAKPKSSSRRASNG